MTKIEEALKKPDRIIRIRTNDLLSTDEARKAGLSVELVSVLDRNRQLLEVGLRLAAKDPIDSRERELFFDPEDLEALCRSTRRVFEVVNERTQSVAEQLPIRYIHSEKLIFSAPGTRQTDPVMLIVGDERPRLGIRPVTITLEGVGLQDLDAALRRSVRAVEQVRESAR